VQIENIYANNEGKKEHLRTMQDRGHRATVLANNYITRITTHTGRVPMISR